MVKKIVVKPTVEIELENILNYLECNWGISSAKKFLSKVRHFYFLLQRLPRIGKMKDIKSGKEIRFYPLTKHQTVIYHIKNDTVVILRFFDNRQHPEKKFKNIK